MKRGRKSTLPPKLLERHPDLHSSQIRWIGRQILRARSNKLRGAYILDFIVPHVGRFHTHRNKKRRKYKDYLKADRARKQELQRQKELTKTYLLY